MAENLSQDREDNLEKRNSLSTERKSIEPEEGCKNQTMSRSRPGYSPNDLDHACNGQDWSSSSSQSSQGENSRPSRGNARNPRKKSVCKGETVLSCSTETPNVLKEV